jgi:hypothetical protein
MWSVRVDRAATVVDLRATATADPDHYAEAGTLLPASVFGGHLGEQNRGPGGRLPKPP